MISLLLQVLFFFHGKRGSKETALDELIRFIRFVYAIELLLGNKITEEMTKSLAPFCSIKETRGEIIVGNKKSHSYTSDDWVMYHYRACEYKSTGELKADDNRDQLELIYNEYPLLCENIFKALGSQQVLDFIAKVKRALIQGLFLFGGVLVLLQGRRGCTAQ